MTEKTARREIARYCMRLYERSLVRGTSGNISVRLDGGDLLVTPSGVSFACVGKDDVVRVDAEGVPRDREQRGTSELPLHLVAYRIRPDTRCVVHTHPTFCVVWSLRGRAFPLDTVGAREGVGSIAWTDFRQNGTRELAELCGDAFSRGVDTILMERHGLSVLGPNLESAFAVTDQAEEAARVAYFADLLAGARESKFTSAP